MESFNEKYSLFCNKTVPKDIHIVFDKISNSKTALGVYNVITNKTYIQEDKWLYLNPEEREIVMYHELGHHVLKLHHIYHLEEDSCPKSIMYYMMFNYECLKKYRDKLMEELFKGSKKC